MNDNETRHDIPNHPPTVGDKRAGGQFQVTLELNGARRTTICPLRTATLRSSLQYDRTVFLFLSSAIIIDAAGIDADELLSLDCENSCQNR
jgi:hypothetical protein